MPGAVITIHSPSAPKPTSSLWVALIQVALGVLMFYLTPLSFQDPLYFSTLVHFQQLILSCRLALCTCCIWKNGDLHSPQRVS